MLARALTKALYVLQGGAFLAAGTSVLLLGTGLLPAPLRDFILEFGQGNDNTLHIMQEFGSLLVFVGLMTFWYVFHLDQSRPFHWAMTLFWGLIALVHWFDVRGGFEYGIGQVINTLPFALFLAVGLLQELAGRGTSPGQSHLG
jgi:hypothetical protein